MYLIKKLPCQSTLFFRKIIRVPLISTWTLEPTQQHHRKGQGHQNKLMITNLQVLIILVAMDLNREKILSLRSLESC